MLPVRNAHGDDITGMVEDAVGYYFGQKKDG